ncbi:FtsK/SpoIIIE domain-containing protein [Lentilactobacillus hilgardii]|uniref:FtsK/SpoIIIE domain-containing protein n=1 Tax=Lentilactobacillus hilgardii TaxID=1588 RepID=UPI0039EB4E97
MNYDIPITKNVAWDASKQISALVAGSRGMGKSWFSMYLALKLATLPVPAQLFAIDFKQSDVSRLAPLLPAGRVATTKDDIFALLERYVSLMKERATFVNDNTAFGATANCLGMPLYYLWYDEFGAFTATLDNKEKKRHDDLLSQIALLGRQYNWGLLAIMQQASVGNSGLNSSIKEQFGFIVHMGSASKVAYRQTFGESTDFPLEKLDRGEGLYWLQSVTNHGAVKPFKSKDLSNIDLWAEFKKAFALQNDSDYLTLITNSNQSRGR